MTFLNGLAQFDGNLLIGIQHALNADWFTMAMKTITVIGNYGWASILLCLILMAYKKTRRLGIVCAASVLLTFICCTGIIKPIVDRARPWEILDGVKMLIADPGDSSFPSGHASNTMSVAFALWLNTRDNRLLSDMDYAKLHRWSYLAIGIALLVGLSRIYLGMHFPSDVIAAMIIAIICSMIIHKIYIKVAFEHVIISKY